MTARGARRYIETDAAGRIFVEGEETSDVRRLCAAWAAWLQDWVEQIEERHAERSREERRT